MPISHRPERKAERNAKILSRRKDGLSFDAIAREFRLSRETARVVSKQMEERERLAQLMRELRGSGPATADSIAALPQRPRGRTP
jgi:hypothetical protein